ncbi:hypothetical protein AMST5_01319 [freshwater sediment metagenome]|uniref:Uncharacterized protein n=1 Tax=freshwater sediment metagenome TaxID=556182 RepID=A0AA48RDK2_9ZZZZ
MKDVARAMDGRTDEELEALKDTDGEDEGDVDADTSSDDADELRRDPAPLLDTHVPADLPQRLAVLDEEKAALVQKFDDGEITAREYSEGLEAIADKRNDADWTRRKAEFAREQHQAAVNRNWENSVSKFMTTTGKDITARGEGALLAFDSYVKKVTIDSFLAEKRARQ